MAFDDLIRRSIASGSFYPADPETLRKQIDGFMESAEPLELYNIKAIISPHAGYIYSGKIAGYSFKQVEGAKYDSIIIIAPSHAEYFDYVSVWQMPLQSPAPLSSHLLMDTVTSTALRYSCHSSKQCLERI